MSQVKEHPILFGEEMILAILDGRKSQTRRPIKDQDDLLGFEALYGPLTVRQNRIPGNENIWIFDGAYGGTLAVRKCPYGVVGDRLWVKETWRPGATDLPTPMLMPGDTIHYRADYAGEAYWEGAWRPSIHMKRWMSRILLEVTGVRVERVKDITPEDAAREGCFSSGDYALANGRWPIINQFRELWDRSYATRGLGWNVDPWVSVVEFKRIEVKKQFYFKEKVYEIVVKEEDFEGAWRYFGLDQEGEGDEEV